MKELMIRFICTLMFTVWENRYPMASGNNKNSLLTQIHVHNCFLKLNSVAKVSLLSYKERHTC